MKNVFYGSVRDEVFDGEYDRLIGILGAANAVLTGATGIVMG